MGLGSIAYPIRVYVGELLNYCAVFGLFGVHVPSHGTFVPFVLSFSFYALFL